MEIPADIKAQAKAITVDIFENSFLSRSVQGRVEDIVAAALFAERERCAKIADDGWGYTDYGAGIPKAIRS